MTWTQVLVAFGVALIPAGLSAYFASRARAAEERLARLRDVEARTAERKYEMYQPMLAVLGDVLTPGRTEEASRRVADVIPQFMTFVGIFGSDEVVQSFFRFRTAANTNPPNEVTIRLVADFLLAARRDIAAPETELTGLHIIGMRISDLYEQDDWTGLFADDFATVCARYEWTPPWLDAE